MNSIEPKIINYTIKKESLEDDIVNVYSELFGHCERIELSLKELPGGYVNSVFKVNKYGDENNCLIFRTYNLKLNIEEFNKMFNETQADNNKKSFEESVFSRETEFNIMKELSKHGLCTRVHSKYDNGVVYDYTPGVTSNGQIMLTKEFRDEMSIKLAKFHSLKIEMPDSTFKTHFDKMTNQVQPIMSNGSIDEKIENASQFPYNDLPTLTYLGNEEHKMLDRLKLLGMEDDIVFCHYDLNQKNIIYNKDNKIGERIGFIDFDLTMYNYSCLELSFLFVCFLGHFIYHINPSYLPDEEYRKTFLSKYLKERHRLAEKNVTDEQFEKELELLMIKTNLGILFSLLGAQKMMILFDIKGEIFQNEEMKKLSQGKEYYYAKIAHTLWKLYCKIKDDFLKQADDYLDNNF